MNITNDLNLEEKWRNATLANNFIFYKVMRQHPEACKRLLEMLLKVKIKKIDMHNEETIDLDHDKKGIRLDVFVKEENRMHDIELQVVDTKELPKRARYYAGLSLPVYSFENICKEDNKIKLNDMDFKHFFIAPTCAKIIEDKELKAFFEFLISNSASNKFTSCLKNYVENAKHNMQWRFQFMTYLRQKYYDMEAGRIEGDKKARIETTKNLLKLNILSVEQIAQAAGLSLEEVLKIQQKKL